MKTVAFLRFQSVVCLASGPSLTPEDVADVRAWRDADPSDRAVIVTNTSFRMALWADVLCAMDYKWWREYGREAAQDFRGRRVSVMDSVIARQHAEIVEVKHPKNSGLAALMLAHGMGARRIGMLGYDAQYTGGKRHHFGNHPVWLGNAGFAPKWPGQFRDALPRLSGVQVVNCSRVTAIDAFPRQPLADFLAADAAQAAA